MAPPNGSLVISGVSGRLPKSDNVDEFKKHLYNHTDLLDPEEKRFDCKFYGLPVRYGQCKNLEKFDATFFGIHNKQAALIDPQIRLLLESTYEALIDAGHTLEELDGSNTGVFVGCCESDAARIFTRYVEVIEGYSVTGCSRSMFANRVSFTFNFKGPSCTTDTACSSSLVAFHLAVQALQAGECDKAVVAGVNLCLIPEVPLQLYRIGMLGSEGICRAFDAKGQGYVRSDGIVALILERRPDARRIYAEVINTKLSTDGYKDEGITFPSGEQQAKLLRRIYDESGLNPSDVTYVEAHGTGTPVGDPQEMAAIDSVLCQNRTEPLLVGSVKSNMGHAEPASGAVGVLKVLISMHEKLIPANLHFEEANPNIPALLDGRVKIVSENTSWNGGLVGINSFGFGGSNAHVILRSWSDTSNDKIQLPSHQPYLVVYSGRTQNAVNKAFDLVRTHKDNPYVVKLMAETANVIPRRNPYRGYMLMASQQCSEAKIGKAGAKKELWFVFTGMGAQWFGMGKTLLKLKPFYESVQRSAEALRPHGIDLLSLFEGKDINGNPSESLTSIMEVFVLLVAIQVGITDCLGFYGIKPDGIIGHSVGEIAAAYSDGAISQAQAMQIAYYRADVIVNGNLPAGKMLAVGLSPEECTKYLDQVEQRVVVACQNSKDSVTLSGPAEDVDKLSELMSADQVFAKPVETFGLAFHSPHMQSVKEEFRMSIEKILPEDPEVSSGKWVSTSIPDITASTFSVDAEYFVHNLASPVQFHDALKQIPDHSLIMEIGPSGILQPLIKRSAPSNCQTIDCMQTGGEDAMAYLLAQLGEVYMAGISIEKPAVLEAIPYPVPLSTPSFNSILEWDHSADWKIEYELLRRVYARIDVDPYSLDNTREDITFVDHIIDGENLFPMTAYIYHAWRHACYLDKVPMEETPIVIQNITVLQAITLKPFDDLLFIYSTTTGDFQFMDEEFVYCTGKIHVGRKAPEFVMESVPIESMELTKEDVYREFMLRGYDYGPHFQNVLRSNLDGTCALIKWSRFWSSFLDAVTQLGLLIYKGDTLYLAHHIDYVAIDAQKHAASVKDFGEEKVIEAFKLPWDDGFQAGGVLLKNAHGRTAPRRIQDNVTLMDAVFVPYKDDHCLRHCRHFQDPDAAETFARQNEEVVDLLSKALSDTMSECSSGSSAEKAERASNSSEASSLVSEPMFQDAVAAQPELDRLWHDCTLKPLLDIVVNNVHHHKLDICVYHPQSAADAALLDTLAAHYPFMKSTVTMFTSADKATAAASSKAASQLKISTCEFGESIPPALKFDVVALKNISVWQNEPLLERAKAALKPEGFIIVHDVSDEVLDKLRQSGKLEKEASWQQLAENNGLIIQTHHSDGRFPFNLVMAQPKPAEQQHLFVDCEDAETFLWVDKLKEELDGISGRQEQFNVWLTSLKPKVNGLPALLNSLKEDYPDYKIKYIYNADFEGERTLSLEDADLKERISHDLIGNVFKSGQWGFFAQIPTEVSDEQLIGDVSKATATTSGYKSLTSLKWTESTTHGFVTYENMFSAPGTFDLATETCSIYYAALNFKDVMLVTGRLPSTDCFVECDALGFEFAGRKNSTGERVMGIVTNGAVGTEVQAQPRYLIPVPDHWSLQEAATTPVVYTTAYYALFIRGRMHKSDKVLIHAGSGGVGLAAIAIAVGHGCEVFTTVSTPEKKELIQSMHSIPDDHFLNSRSTDFLAHILQLTHGRGVDIVLNSLSEEKLVSSVECLAKDGRFLEIGKYDMYQDSPLGMKCFLKNISFVSVVGERMFQEGNHDWPEVLRLFQEGIAAGIVKPLPQKVFEKEQVSDAIRYMAAGKHKGKVLIKIREEESDKSAMPAAQLVAAKRRLVVEPDDVCIITGGLGGIGMELSQFLIRRGAKKLLLTSRRGVTTAYQKRTIDFWHKRGIRIEVSTLDVTENDQAKGIMEHAQRMGNVAGIFHLAVKAASQDVIFENETSETFRNAVGAKYIGARNLDEHSRAMCGPNLKWFVMFSSVSSSFQYLALGNYSWANNALDRLVEKRRHDGLRGNSIQWGPVGDVGILYNMNKDNNFVFFGLLPQRLNSILDTLEKLLIVDRAVMISCVRGGSASLSGAKSKRSIAEAISAILGLSADTMNPDTPFEVYGIDSLIGVEMRQILERDYGIIKSVKELKKLTPNELRAMVQEEEP